MRVGRRMKRLPDVEREGGREDESVPDVYSEACRAPAFQGLRKMIYVTSWTLIKDLPSLGAKNPGLQE